jgi:GAF domain-containing protein
MSNDELGSPLESLFSDGVPQPEGPTPEPEQIELIPGEGAESTRLAAAGLFSSDEAPVEEAEEAPPDALGETAPVVEEMPRERPIALDEASSSEAARFLSLLWESQRGESIDGQVEDELEQGRERILNLLLGGAAVGGGVVVLALIVGIIQKFERLLVYFPFFCGYALIVVAFRVRRIPMRWRVGVLIGVSYAVALLSIWQNGLVGTAPWYLLATPLLFFILVSDRAGVLSGVVSTVVYVLLAVGYHLGLLRVDTPIELADSLSQTLVVSTSFALVTMIVVVVQLLFSRAQRQIRLSLQEQSTELQESHAVSAQRQQELERANTTLQRQAQHFELGIQIGRVAAMGLGVDEFTDRVVRLIHERVASHYVGLLTLDESREHAQLRATAGRSIDLFSPEQQRLPVSSDLLLRQCVSSGRARILLGIDQVQSLSEGDDEVLLLLSDTRSAMALPLIARGEVFGAITVQSRSPAAFRNEDMVSLRAVADQVATAISNAQLTDELQARLEEMETLQRYYVREAWDQFLATEATKLYEYDQPGVDALGNQALPEVDRVLNEPRITVFERGEASAPSVLASPISLREQVLGVLGLHRSDTDEPWTEEQVELVEAISEQMGLIIENSRLFAEAQSRAARERRAREITARMRQSLDVETVLQTAVREMGESLLLRDVTIQLLADYEGTVEG